MVSNGFRSPTPRGGVPRPLSQLSGEVSPSKSSVSSPSKNSPLAWPSISSGRDASGATSPVAPESVAAWAENTQSNLLTARMMRQEAQAKLSKGLSSGVCSPGNRPLVEKQHSALMHNQSALQERLKARMAASETIVAAVQERIECSEQVIFRMQHAITELVRYNGQLYASLSVVEKRLEMRAGRPVTELVRDGGQEALEKEKQVLTKHRTQVAKAVEEGRILLEELEEVNSAICRERHVLPSDRTGRAQEMLLKAKSLEQEGSRFVGDAGLAARLRVASQKEVERASLRTQAAMKRRVTELLEARRHLEKEVKETVSTIAEAEWHLEKNQKLLQRFLQQPEKVDREYEAWAESMRSTFLHPVMIKIRDKIKSAAFIGASGMQLDVLFGRFDKDKSGYLDEDEVRKALRRTLRISPALLSDAEVASLCNMLDADRNGNISILELSGFIASATDAKALNESILQAQEIVQKLEAALSSLQSDLRSKTAAWKIEEACVRVTAIKSLELDAAPGIVAGSRGSSRMGSRARHYGCMTPEVQEKLRTKIKQAAYTGHAGSKQLETIFSRLDKDGSGELDESAVKTALRRVLRIPVTVISDQEIGTLCATLDRNCTGSISIDELVEFVGTEPEISKRTGKETPEQSASQKEQPSPKTPRKQPLRPLSADEDLGQFIEVDPEVSKQMGGSQHLEHVASPA